MVPVIVWLLVAGHTQAAFGAFLIAGLSDAADGYIAKRYNQESELGAYLDPLADKMLIVCIFVSLGIGGELPAWLVIAVVARDVLIVSGVLLSWVLGQPLQIRPSILSKTNTATQIALAAIVLADMAFTLKLSGLRTFLVWMTAVLTVASLAQYLQNWLRHMSEPVKPL